MKTRTYANGQPVFLLKSGRMTYFFKTGIKKAEGPHVDGKMEGKWTFYRDGGQLWGTGQFEHNLKHGRWIRYDRKGKLEYDELFGHGKLKKPSPPRR